MRPPPVPRATGGATNPFTTSMRSSFRTEALAVSVDVRGTEAPGPRGRALQRADAGEVGV